MSQDFAAVDRLLEDALSRGLGSAAAVSIGDGHLERFRTWRGALQRVPTLGPPVNEESLFDLASLTKPMVTAALAMRYVDRGALDLDAPVRRWLPDAATTGTVAQLLGHAAGCAPHVKFYEQLDRQPGADSPRRQILRLARTHPLIGEPGRDTAYSDLGYMMLGELLEKVEGGRLDTLFRGEISARLGLEGHFFPLGGETIANAWPVPSGNFVATELAPAHEGGAPLTGVVHDENARAAGGVLGHAGLFGRIGDVAAFAQAVLASVQPEAWSRGNPMPALCSPATAQLFFGRAPGGASWRLGWDTPSPRPGISHAGDLWPRDSGAGHLGFTGTSLWLDLARGRWVALLTNRVHPSREGSAEGIKLLRRAVMDTAWQLLEAP
jgi:serine-type D-Ala-D-Ala carboxypeptidase